MKLVLRSLTSRNTNMKHYIFNLDKQQYATGTTFLTLINTNMKLVLLLNLDKHQYETGNLLNLDKHQYETGTTFLTLINTNMKLVLRS